MSRRKTFRVCEVEGCTNTSDTGRVYGKQGKFKMDLCDNHWAQMNNHGKILERTRFTPNEFMVAGDVATMVLYDMYGNKAGVTLLSSKHIEKVKEYKWHLTGGYVKTTVPGIGDIKLHRFITDAPKGSVIDHINHETLDNRDENLRICTQQENMWNTSLRSNNKSGVKGVSWCKRKEKWVVRIRVNKKYLWIGEFIDKQDATIARKQAEAKYCGDFAYKTQLCPTMKHNETVGVPA